ncbi:MAG: type IV pilus twitching motility protein PilT [Deltaproteobacteria bacterium]|nr:type IV pilus twitching motility protein PilT [Deltaproteobacteria bacterium]
MNDRGASDLHLSVGRPPMFRDSGQMDPIRYRVLDNRDFVELMKPIARKEWTKYKSRGDVDFSYEVPGVARFRVNMFMQERGYGAVFRIIPTKLMTFEQLGLPKPVQKFCNIRKGLILVTGPTGSGKSTTLSSIINKMNTEQALHIITIEDPIEFVHPNKKSVISQREIGAHAISFAKAVQAAVREDPDIILIGEMRDLETIRTALSAAESGFTVFGTLHTNNAAKAVDRIINVFPQEEQEAVRGGLAESLRGVVAQQLLRRKAGGRVAALEILFSTSGLSSMIRDGKTSQITSSIQMGKKMGMRAMDDSLWELLTEDIVTADAAYEKAVDKAGFRDKLAGIGIEVEG